jgi:PAS domain S-box-containing protein
MHIDLIGNLRWFIQLPVRLEGLILLAVYGVLIATALISWRGTLTRLTSRRWLLLGGLTAAAFVLCNVFVWYFPITDLPPLPNSPQSANILATPLLSGVCILLAIVWLDAGPALALSLLSGFLLAGFNSGQFTLRFEIVAFGATAASLMRQNYQGRLYAIVRQPIIAGPLAAIVTWPFMLPSFYSYIPGEALPALNTAWPLFISGWWPTLIAGIVAGLIAQLALALLPVLRLPLAGRSVPPWARSLNRRMLYILIPFGAVLIVTLVYAVSATALSAAKQQAIVQMSHDATTAARQVPNFFTMGQGLIQEFSADDRFSSPDPAVRAARLASAIRIGPFFDELWEFDSTAKPISVYNQGPSLTAEENTLIKRALQTGAPQTSSVFNLNGNSAISFIAAIIDPASGQPRGAMLGRTQVEHSPMIDLLRHDLQNTLGAGVGYLLDGNQQIVIHPKADLVLTHWSFDTNLKPAAELPAQGKAYDDHFPDGTPRLLFVQPVEGGNNWSVVIELPFATVLQLAAGISTPLLLLLLLLGLFAVIGLSFFTRIIVQPIKRLSVASANIARGQLDRPITPSGQDEVGQLSSAFEQMRQSLKGRLDDLSLLLRVSQTVSASLDLERGVPPLLSGALQATPARMARLVLLAEDGTPESVLTTSEGAAALTTLDKTLTTLAIQSETPLLIDNVSKARARASLDPNLVGPGIRAIAALPVRRQAKAIGVMWFGYSTPYDFKEAEVNLLGTLAGQAAVLIENARLFLAAEGGRRRLEAVLSSTSDAVVVTDKENRVLLCNPAAEVAFGLQSGSAIGRSVEELWSEGEMERLLMFEAESAVRTEEIVLPDGRTLYGSASNIISGDGQLIGQVAVLRDITHFKELDAMKSEFVATVSHDLRAPLTYMRGYTTMLPMVGSLSPKQQDYLSKIMAGIEQMTELIDDLLDLGRIDAGVGIVRADCSLAEIVRNVVDTLQGQASARSVNLVTGNLALKLIQGDQGLIRHAITNLVDNALKYTSPNGSVTVSVQEGDDFMVVAVKDSGIGVAPADQARLFERFYRVKRRETIDIKGTGLGLAIVKSIADWHQGRVWVESQLGQGSTFYLLLPISA